MNSIERLLPLDAIIRYFEELENSRSSERAEIAEKFKRFYK